MEDKRLQTARQLMYPELNLLFISVRLQFLSASDIPQHFNSIKLSNGCTQTSVLTPDRGTQILVLAILHLQNPAQKDGGHEESVWMWWQRTQGPANGMRKRFGCGGKEHKDLLMA
jgi:hypothetical protein